MLNDFICTHCMMMPCQCSTDASTTIETSVDTQQEKTQAIDLLIGKLKAKADRTDGYANKFASKRNYQEAARLAIEARVIGECIWVAEKLREQYR